MAIVSLFTIKHLSNG